MNKERLPLTLSERSLKISVLFSLFEVEDKLGDSWPWDIDAVGCRHKPLELPHFENTCYLEDTFMVYFNDRNKHTRHINSEEFVANLEIYLRWTLLRLKKQESKTSENPSSLRYWDVKNLNEDEHIKNKDDYWDKDNLLLFFYTQCKEGDYEKRNRRQKKA